jgi:hypothetical protein
MDTIEKTLRVYKHIINGNVYISPNSENGNYEVEMAGLCLNKICFSEEELEESLLEDYELSRKKK